MTFLTRNSLLRSTLTFLVFIASTLMCASQQDTLRLSLAQADSLLRSKNLSVIAARYDVDKAHARVIQAQVFANPSFTAESFLYSPDHKGVFDPSYQKSFSIQQLFRIAGQHGLEVELAEEAKSMSSLQYAQLVRALKYQLHNAYYSLYYLSNATRALNSQLHRLDGTVREYQKQYEKGNFSLKELARLKTTLFELNNNYTQLSQEIIDLQRDLRVLVANDAVIVATPTSDELRVSPVPSDSLNTLVAAALQSRLDVAISQSSLRQSELKLSLEKRKAIPDLHLGLNYDQGGSLVNNYTGISLGVDLPIFDRNQGGIAEAEADVRQSEVEHQATQQVVRRQIEASVEKIKALREQYNQIGTTFLDDIDTLTEAVLQNYLNGNLSLMEFTDLFESYNSSIIDINRFYAALFKSYEDLNYAVGKELFR